jgi:hypothetical protein
MTDDINPPFAVEVWDIDDRPSLPEMKALLRVLELLELRRFAAEGHQQRLASDGEPDFDWGIAMGEVAGISAAIRTVQRVMQETTDAG